MATGESREIPFHVRDSRRVSEVVRFPVEVAPEQFPVKMLRWVQVAPDGDRVVFQALGRLWIRELADGEPRRLTRQDDHFELYPAWSRDGKSIVYTTWDDEELGSVRVVAAGGGEERVLTRQPGHFVEPVVSPRVITMRGDEVIEDGTVVVRGRRIEAVGPRGEVDIPTGAVVVDVSGNTVLPGLIDVHWHDAMASDEITPEQNWYLDSSLAFGVATIHDPSNDTSQIFAASEMEKAGILRGPRSFSTGTILYGARSPVKAVIDSFDDALSHLRRLQAVGAITVKSYNQPRRDQRQQVIAAARELWMFVQGGMTPHQALRAATLWGATYLGMDGDLGSLEPGKLADVIVVEGNPLEDIRTSENVRCTVADGRLYDALEMNQLLPEPKERAPYYFEAANRAAMAGAEGTSE